MQVFRGSTNPASVMGAHSLLEEMYGNEYVYGTVSTRQPHVSATFQQLVNITLDTSTRGFTRTRTAQAPPIPGHDWHEHHRRVGPACRHAC